MRWQPAKPRTRIKVIECGAGRWDEQDHRLDIPHAIDTIDFKVTGTGHERIEKTHQEGCRNGWKLVAFSKGQRELEIAAWLCQHACSFVLFDTKTRVTVNRVRAQVRQIIGRVPERRPMLAVYQRELRHA